MPWIIGGAMVLGAGASYMAGKEQKEGMEAAGEATLQAQREALEAYAPYREMGERAIPELERLAGETGVSPYLGELESRAAAGAPSQYLGELERLYEEKGAAEPYTSKYLPYLDYLTTGEGTPFDIQTSPLYQYQLEKGTEATRKAAAARGGFASGAAMELETDLARRLGAEETEKLYGRLTGLYGMGREEEMLRRQAETERFGQASGLYGLEAEREAQGYGRYLDLYNIGQQQKAQQYGRTLDLTKIGAGAAGEAGAASMTTGGQLASQAQAAGAAQAGMYTGMANIGMAGAGAYQQQQGYQELMSRMYPTTPAPAPAPAPGYTTSGYAF